MPKWIHSRAEHLLAKNPSMPKSMAFGIATQQSHALGKSPKGYGTAEGKREAKQKYDTPKDDKKAANPGNLNSPKLAGASVAALREEYLSQVLYDELTKLAEGLNIGLWWEQVGGPFLAKGGSVAEFKKMMQEAGVPPAAQARFTAVAEKRYAQARAGAARSAAAGSAYSRPDPSSYWDPRWSDPAATSDAVREHLRKHVYGNPVTQGAGAAAALGSLLYAGLAPQKADPEKGPSRTTAHLANIGSGVLPGVASGAFLGRVFGGRAPLIGGALGGALGGVLGHQRFKTHEMDAERISQRALKKPDPDKAEKRLVSAAGQSAAALSRSGIAPALLTSMLMGAQDTPIAGPIIGSAMVANALGAVGERYKNVSALQKYRDARNREQLKAASVSALSDEYQKIAVYLHGQVHEPKTKALGATPPNPKFRAKLGFQVSQYSGPLGTGRMRYHSMIPPWHEPPLQTAPGKEEGEKKASVTGELRPPSTGGGLTPAGRLRSAQSVGKPRATAPPGPSISQIAKPVGFGKPLPGAVKTGL